MHLCQKKLLVDTSVYVGPFDSVVSGWRRRWVWFILISRYPWLENNDHPRRYCPGYYCDQILRLVWFLWGNGGSVSHLCFWLEHRRRRSPWRIYRNRTRRGQLNSHGKLNSGANLINSRVFCRQRRRKPGQPGNTQHAMGRESPDILE
jgi:hypothetical protein